MIAIQFEQKNKTKKQYNKHKHLAVVNLTTEHFRKYPNVL